MPHWNNQPWQRNLSKIASGKPGAVQCFMLADASNLQFRAGIVKAPELMRVQAFPTRLAVLRPD